MSSGADLGLGLQINTNPTLSRFLNCPGKGGPGNDRSTKGAQECRGCWGRFGELQHIKSGGAPPPPPRQVDVMRDKEDVG